MAYICIIIIVQILFGRYRKNTIIRLDNVFMPFHHSSEGYSIIWHYFRLCGEFLRTSPRFEYCCHDFTNSFISIITDAVLHVNNFNRLKTEKICNYIYFCMRE